ncbi:MtrB/PioB family decaheme-associated outer membrane protein [Marilutibacter alkalisoli]|nr:MtrB/PioB family decaheme-associated outer membrane protein [Lysobacter alkalisoli]
MFGHLGSDDFRFGRYAGEGGGMFAALDIDACRRLHPGADGAEYWFLRGRDLGLATHTLAVGGGEQGRFNIEAEARRLASPRVSGWTPLLEQGSDGARLPPDWVAGTSTVDMPGLRLPELGEVDLESIRRQRMVGLAFAMPRNWRIETRYRHESRQGRRGFGGVIGSTGGNARAIVLPESIDHLTRQADTTLSYAGERLQLRIGHHLSQFDNGHSTLRWQNPFAGVAGWAPSASHPSGFGQAQPAPDNRFQQFSLAGAYSRSAAFQINADLAFGRMTQDQPFLPYTIDPVLAAEITQPLPRASLDGRIDTTVAHLRLSGRPHPHWRWSATYRLDDRDNKTASDEYVVIGGDSQQQNATPASGQRRYNLPYGIREQTLSADTGYRPTRRFDLGLGFEHRQTDRTWSSRADSDETRLKFALRSHFGEMFAGGVRVDGSRRSGSTYVGNRAFLASHSQAYVETVAGGFENLPALRQYHLADRDRRQVQLFATLTPTAALSIGLEYGSTHDDYRRSELGLRRSRIDNVGLGVDYASMSGWSLHGYAERARFSFDQAGHSFRGGGARLDEAADPDRDWFAQHRDRADSIGFGISRELFEGRLKLRADYSHVRSTGAADVTAGAALEVGPLPETVARLQRLDLLADIRLRDHVNLRLRYGMESFRSTDWAFDGVGPDTLAGVILLGEQSPDYRADAVMMSMHWRF